MAAIDVFRTYPAPGSSWRRWRIYIDGAEQGQIGGAGHSRIAVVDGEHEVKVVHGKSESMGLAVNVRSGQLQPVLVGQGVRDAEGFGIRRIGIRECTDTSDLPRGAIPLHAPSGNTQIFVQGRTKAVVGLVGAVGIDLILWVLGVVALVLGISGHEPIRIVAGLIPLAIGAWFALKLWPGVRIVRNQWSWPLEDWRVDAKGEERDEWRRWSDEVPDPTP
jgi:hypothetical protein